MYKRQDEEIFKAAQKAVEENRKIEILYHSTSGKKKPLTLEPHKLIYSYLEGFWYLASRCAGVKGLMKSRLDRILELTPTPEKFVPSQRILKLIRDSRTIWFNEKRDKKVRIKVSAGVAARSILEREHFPLQKIVKRCKDGSIVIETTLCSYMEAIPTIYRAMPYMVVLSPKDLALTVKKTVSTYLKAL